MKTLNLDALAKIERTVTWKGVEHSVTEMSVEDFIGASEDAKKLSSLKEDDVRTNMDATVRHIRRVIPTLPEVEIRTMPMSPLMALIEFINSAVEVEQEKADSASGN